MKFLDRLNVRRGAKLLAAAVLSGALLFGGNAFAAPNDDDMAAFREAYLKPEKTTRLIEQYLSLVSNNFHLDINSKVQVTVDGVLTMDGEFSWSYTNLKKNYSTNNFIPFYIEQQGNEMTLYVKRIGRWKKMILPGLPSGLAAIWKSSDNMLRENIDAVKAVTVLEDTPDMRIMDVTLDGKKIAALLERNSQESFAGLKGDELAAQQAMLKRWITAIGADDIKFAWTVNKPSWTTATTSFDLTPIMRAYSRYVLDEAAAGRVILTDEERDLLDAMGYYAELRAYTTRVAPKAESLVRKPADLTNVPEDDNALDDIFAEMTTVVEK